MTSDWMPGKRADVLAMARDWVIALPDLQAQTGVTGAEMAELAALAAEAKAARKARLASPGDRVAATREREAFGALKAFMRMLRRRRFFFTTLDGDAWVRLALKPRDRVRTAHFEMRETVEFEIGLRNIRELLVRFWVKGAQGRARPAHCTGALIAWALLDKPPAGIHDLRERALATRTPHALEFHEADRGKTVYIALAWQNTRGILGTFSDIQSAVVP